MQITVNGLKLTIVGFWGFLMACVIVHGKKYSWSLDDQAIIYSTPIIRLALVFNILMRFFDGIISA